MVRDYTCEYYMDAHQRFRAMEANGAARARELAAAMDRIRSEWHNIWIGAVEDGPKDNVPVASTIRVRAKVHLGRLAPQDVAVDLYIGRVGPNDELMEGRTVPLHAEGKDAQDTYNYVGETAMARSGLHGFTVRVRPSHPDLTVAFVPSLICWAEEARVGAVVG
jgi:starch phosphorylase